MHLFSAVLLSVGAALFVGVLGRLNSSLSIPPQFLDFIHPPPPWFHALVISCALFFGIRWCKYEEDIVILPFAVAGTLLSFGSGVTTGAGVLILVFALIGFANAKSDGTIPSDLRALSVWLAASAVCVLVTWACLRLFPIVVSEVCGLIAFLAGISLFRLHLKAEKRKIDKK